MDNCRVCRQHPAVIPRYGSNKGMLCAVCRRALRKAQRTSPFGRMSCWPAHYTANTSCVKRLCIARHIGVELKIDPDDNPDII
jgi:hypothetical protein